MAASSTILVTLFIFVLNLQVKRSSFVDSDFIGLTLLGNEIDEVNHGETFYLFQLISSEKWQVLFSYSKLEAKLFQRPYPYVR